MTPTLSVDEAHARSTSELEVAIATRFVGVVGGVVSGWLTVIIACTVELPLAFIAVMAYVTVELGLTTSEPVVELLLKFNGAIEIDVAAVVDQESVDVAPAVMEDGVIEKELTTGSTMVFDPL